jgi:hypothetical protein
MIARFSFILCMLLCLVARGANQTKLQVQRGWGDQERSGRWNPLFVTASDPQPRNAILEIVTAHEGSFSMVVRERIAIGPNPQTFELFIPSHYSPWGQNVAVLRDAESGKRLAQFPSDVGEGPPSFAPQGPQGIVIGVTGQRALMQNLESGMKSASVRTAYVPIRMLPRSAIGYDSLDVLFLNEADLGQIDADQQSAIVDWVRTGGNVLVTPGASPLPDSGMLLAALPARIGAVGMVNLSPAALKAADLPPRFARMSSRTLEPVEGAKPLPLFDGAVTAYQRRIGLGQVLLCPIDLGGMQFNADESAGKFWRPVVQQFVPLPDPAQRENPTNYYYGYQPETPDQQHEAGAINTLCDFIGDVPGAGRFGFSYVAVALVAMMIVVGPVDWFVLRRLGQQPWTWVTTAGWVGLITLGAIFIGYLFKSGDLYYRTVRVVEQVDDRTVATADLVGIYSPRTREYDLTPAAYLPGEPAGWWQPAVPGGGDVFYNRSPKTDIVFHQSDAANTPDPMLVSVWNVRFLRSESHVSAEPVIEASLSLQPSAGRGLRLVGTIKNLSAQALKDLHVRTQFGVIEVPLPGQTLAPQQSVKVDAPSSGTEFPQTEDRRYQNYGPYGSRTYETPANEQALWAIAPDLSGRRSMRITAMLTGNSDFACVYAQFINPPPAATLGGDAKRIEQHYQWLRAVVAMKK